MPGSYRIERWNREDTPNAEELRQLLKADGYNAFQWTDRPGAVYDEHSHENDQSHWVVSGMIELQIRGEGAFVLSPGDRDFMPAGASHAARVVGNEPVTYFIGEKKRECEF
jgi:quercetin dioxygenase-like cupin family protein